MHVTVTSVLSAAVLGAMSVITAHAQTAPRPKMATDIPPAITMPDNLDFQHGVQVMLTAIPAASLNASRRGVRSFGPDNQTVIVFESLMDSRTLFLTANTESIYAVAWSNLKDGPVVVESPPNTLGLVDDFWFRYVTDLGNAGPDKGKGGKFLFLPPGYTGSVPAGYHVFKSRTIWFGATSGVRGEWSLWRSARSLTSDSSE